MVRAIMPNCGASAVNFMCGGSVRVHSTHQVRFGNLCTLLSKLLVLFKAFHVALLLLRGANCEFKATQTQTLKISPQVVNSTVWPTIHCTGAVERAMEGKYQHIQARTCLHSAKWSNGNTPFSGALAWSPLAPPKAPPALMKS